MPANFPSIRTTCSGATSGSARSGRCVADVVETVGWDRVLFGSDYPHPEGLAEPRGFWKYAEGMDARRTYDFMGDNARRFMGLPIANPNPAAVKPPAMANA
jgi:predicted TIM-barrel fold metal-dependent hydrolase